MTDTRTQDLLSLEGRTAIVTGAALGIGRSVAQHLAAAGAAVVLADIDGAAVDLTAKELADRGHAVLPIQTDVSVEDEVERLVQTAAGWRAGIDILVNNAGVFPTVPVLDMSAEEFDRVIAVNLRGVYLCSRLAAQRMVEQGRGGRIITVTSVDALHPSSVGLAHYDASKHGAWGFTKNLALELAPHGISVNAIAPGGVDTPGVHRMQAAIGVDPTEILRQFTQRIPMGRLADPDEIGAVALFLASDMSSYLTGSQLVVDGGVLLS